MEKSYLYLSLMMMVTFFAVFVITTVLQTKVAILAIPIYAVILLLFYIRDKSEEAEVIAMWFALIMFFVTAAVIFIPGGF